MQLYDNIVTVTEVPKDEGGLPQIKVIKDGSYTNQVFWLVISFVILYMVVAKLVLPRINGVLEEREERIATDLDRAERLRQDAEKLRVEYEENMAIAKSNAQKILADTKDDIQTMVNEAAKKHEQELQARIEQAQNEIQTAKLNALDNVGDIASGLVGDILAKLDGDKITSDHIDSSIDTVLSLRKKVA